MNVAALKAGEGFRFLTASGTRYEFVSGGAALGRISGGCFAEGVRATLVGSLDHAGRLHVSEIRVGCRIRFFADPGREVVTNICMAVEQCPNQDA